MIKIALAQLDVKPNLPFENIKQIETNMIEAKGCDIIIFPEMSDIGYTPESLKHNAQSWEENSFFHTVQQLAKTYNITTIIGLSERKNQKLYNSLAIISNTGKLIDKYRKIHLFNNGAIQESETLTPGNKIVTFPFKNELIGLSICFDLRFPELYRALRSQGATILINCSAWPTVRKEHWLTLTKARAIENQAFFIGVNRAGTDDGLSFAGHSLVISPTGENLLLANNSPSLNMITIDPLKVKETRDAFPVFKCISTIFKTNSH